MRGGGRTEFLYREITPVLTTDIAFLTFLEHVERSVVSKETFIESPSITVSRRYEAESERLLKEIRAAKRDHLRGLKKAS